MRPSDQEKWKQDVVELVFSALARHPALADHLVFKGGQVLNLRLPISRRVSVDLDATARESFSDVGRNDEERAAFLNVNVKAALTAFFGAQDVVRFSVTDVTTKRKPRDGHPRGWDAFEVRIRLRDALRPGVHALPTITIDVSAPENLLPTSVEPLHVRDAVVNAYSLSRLAAEKLRGILQSLRSYRAKTHRRPGAVRVRDIYDVAAILAERPIDDEAFWSTVASEFADACRSRSVDCLGMTSFEEDIASTKSAYESDATIPEDIDFDSGWEAIVCIVRFLERLGVVPFENPDE